MPREYTVSPERRRTEENGERGTCSRVEWDCIIEEDLGNKCELDAFLQDVPDCSGHASGLCVYAEGGGPWSMPKVY